MSDEKQTDPQDGKPETAYQDNRRAVYQELCNSYRAIDDFRTKLLGFLPLATGTGLFLLVTDEAKIKLAQPYFWPIGVFGFIITLGLFFYELYGIKKCTYLIRAGIKLEGDLNINAGQFGSRPLGVLGLISEPFAAGVIYPAVLGAWMYLALAFPHLQDAAQLQPEPAAQLWAIRVFLVGFAIAFFYNLFLIKEDIRRVIVSLKTRWGTRKRRRKTKIHI